MIDWVKDGVMKSSKTLADVIGGPVPSTFQGFGPRGEFLVDRVMDSEVPLDTGTIKQSIAYTSTVDWGVGLHHYVFHGTCDDVHIVGCSIEGATKWASRSYRMRHNNRFTNCAFRDTWPEHDIYWNLAGYGAGEKPYPSLKSPSLIIRGCFFQDTGSQNVQIVQRAEEQGFDAEGAHDLTPGGPIVVVDCLSRNAGVGIDVLVPHPGGDPRSAFAFSFFESQNDVYMNRVFVDKTMQRISSGCLLIERRPKAIVRQCAFLSSEAKQPLAIFRDIDDLVIRSSVFQAASGQNWIYIERCKRVTIQGCKGTAQVHFGKNPPVPVNVDSAHVDV